MPNSLAKTECITDPVTGFHYPAAWVAACRDPAGLALVRSGLAVLTSAGTVLRRGFSTGTTAAACCKAAILSVKREISDVTLTIPSGLTVTVPVSGSGGRASCRKYAGDYPADATAGILFIAEYRQNEPGIELVPGEGIGRFVRDTPRYRAGQPAISRPAQECISRAMEEAVAETGLPGASVLLTLPDGVRVGAETLNPKVGIARGISLLGTTGLVEPWDDHLTASVLERVSASERLVITTGRIGLRFARLLFPDHDVILAGAKIREALSAAHGEVILCGLPGLVLKFFLPDILEGTGLATVEELSYHPEFEERMQKAFLIAAENFPDLRVVVIDRDGTILGDSG